jgi:glycine betaine/proline transport system ATP-binding protein
MPTDAETLIRGTAARSAREPSGADRAVMISCRHLWKLYGPHSAAAPRLDTTDIEIAIERARVAGQIPAVCDVSFDVREGEIFVIMGLSGSGKSTVVRCLSRLVEPTAGAVTIAGRDLLALKERELIELRRHKMGMVFQNFGLLPHLNVLDNVAYPLRVQGLPLEERYRRAE